MNRSEARRLTRRRTAGAAGVVVLVGLVGACTSTEPEGPETIPADEFIDTYVELRIAALRNPSGEITAEQRDSVLTQSGVLSDEMVEFAEVHGRRAIYMQAVWDSVEVRFQRKRSELNSGAGEPSTQ